MKTLMLISFLKIRSNKIEYAIKGKKVKCLRIRIKLKMQMQKLKNMRKELKYKMARMLYKLLR
jgi:hypothetical protein